MLSHSQVDNTYARNIESLVHKVCTLSRQQGVEHSLLRAASLQCLSAMVNVALQLSFFISVIFFTFQGNLFECPVQLTIVILVQIWFMKEHSYIFADFDEVTTISSFSCIAPLVITCGCGESKEIKLVSWTVEFQIAQPGCLLSCSFAPGYYQ